MREAGNPSAVQDNMTVYCRSEGPISFQSTAFADLAREVLSRGQLFRFCAPGTSMSPLIRDGDIVTIAPVVHPSFGVGDIVAFVRSGEERLVVHRIVSLRTEGCVTRGDNATESDGIVSFESVLGIVVGVERSGTLIRAGLGPERTVVAVLSRRGCLRPFIGVAASLFRTMRRSR